MLFEPFKINGVEFSNRVLRSSIGGRTSYFDGTVSPAFTAFERRFAEAGVGGIISATISVNRRRMSPMQYPALHDDAYVGPLRETVRAVQALGSRYIIQIGDPGGHTHTGLLPEKEDAMSASSFFDFLYGYRNKTIAMTQAEIETAIDDFASAARRVRETGSDGVEITASKGYLIHQFLNPGTNRRSDAYGGSVEKRFHFLERVVRAARERVGRDFLLGVRLSAQDYNYLPLNFRFPIVFPLRHYFIGNTLKETLFYGKKLEALGVDYLHIDSGFGFPNPKGNTGTYPQNGFKLFVNATRHLSFKAGARAFVVNMTPPFLARALFGLGWNFKPAANADFAGGVQARGWYSRRRQWRLSEAQRDRCGAHPAQMRHGGDCAPAAGQSRSARSAQAARRTAQAMLLLQRVLHPHRRAAARLLRYQAVRYARTDERPDRRHVVAERRRAPGARTRRRTGCLITIVLLYTGIKEK